MGNDHSISRRKFLGAAAGAAGAAAFGSWAPRASADPAAASESAWSRRASSACSTSRSATRSRAAASRAAGRRPDPDDGLPGRPELPRRPTDLGPLVPLPGGYIEVFEYLASVGFRGFEFFQYTQNVNELGRQPTHAEIRSYLDNAGLPVVRHPHGRTRGDGQRDHAQRADRDRPHAGAHDDRHGRRPRRRRRREPPRQLGGRGQQLQPRRPGPLRPRACATTSTRSRTTSTSSTTPRNPSLSRVHRIDWFTEHTDPSARVLRAGHPALLRRPRPLPRSRRRVALARAGLLEAATPSGSSPGTSRTAAGSCRRPPAGVNPFTQIARSARRRSTDAILVGRGLDRPGLPGRSRTRPSSATSSIFDEVGQKGSQLRTIVETDSGPGPAKAQTPAARCATPSTACRTCWGCAAA